MAYTTAVYDRTNTDIYTKTSKAYLNVADWTRIYNNCQLVSSLSEILTGAPISFILITIPTTASIPTIDDLRNITGNIETLRAAVVAAETITGIDTEIKTDWFAGASYQAPNYQDVNAWERTIDLIWDFYNGDSYDVCPTLTGNVTVTTGNYEIYIDCIDMADYNIDLQGTANLYII